LSLVERSRVVFKDSSFSLEFAKRRGFVVALGIVPELVASEDGTVFVSGVVRFTSAPFREG